jgi:hypothetical protein
MSCFCLVFTAFKRATHQEIDRMKRISLAFSAATMAVALAACQTSGPIHDSGPVQASRPTDAVQGQWFDTSGVAFSNFNGGVFETRANDTKEKLAEGSYRFASASLIEINLRSLARGTQSKVNCALVNPGQLNCTSSSGQQFSLTRRGGQTG